MTTQQTASSKSRSRIGRKQASHSTGEETQRMIAEAAYFHAEHRGFKDGSPDDDWFLAEAEIEAMLSEEQPH